MKYSFILNGEVLYTIIYVQFRIVKSFTQSCTEFFLTWIMLSEFHRGVTLVGVVGRCLTALSHSLLRRRFLLRQNDNCSQMRGRIARFTSRWNGYLECETPFIAPMGTASHALAWIQWTAGPEVLWNTEHLLIKKLLISFCGGFGFDFVDPVVV